MNHNHPLSHKNYNILSLLPYADNAELINKQQKIDDLYFIKSIIEFSNSALKTFLSRKLSAFDTQVGENLCQIRAYQIVHLANKWLANPTSTNKFMIELKSIKAYKQTLDTVIHDWENAIKKATSYNKDLDHHEKTIDFLDRHGLLLNLHKDLVFIIAACYLTHFNIRDDNLPIAINLNYIAHEFHISKYRAKRLTHKYQQLLCFLGCDFILTISKELPSFFDYDKFLPKLYQIADEHRAVLACYFVSEVIFNHSLQNHTPVLLIVRRKQQPSNTITDVIYFLLTVTKNNSDYSISKKNQPLLQENCIIVTGDAEYTEESISNYVERILHEGPLNIILANTASHPQYSGKNLVALRSNPFAFEQEGQLTEKMKQHQKKFMDIRHDAYLNGCCKENPTTFFLKHIYASNINNEIRQLEARYMNLVKDAFLWYK